MDFKTIACDTYEGHMKSDRIYPIGYLLYELGTNKGKFSDGEHHYKDLPYFSGSDEISSDTYKITSNLLKRGEKTLAIIDSNTNESKIYSLYSENAPKIDTLTGVVTFPNGINDYYKSSVIDEITGNINTKVSTIENTVAEQGDIIQQMSEDDTILVKVEQCDVDASVCTTLAENIDCVCECCECESCEGCKLRDFIRVCKENSPKINLLTGKLSVPGGIEGYVKENVYRQKIADLEERIRALEERQ